MVSRLCDDGVQGRDGRCVENSSCFQIFLFVPVCILLLGSPAGLIPMFVCSFLNLLSSQRLNLSNTLLFVPHGSTLPLNCWEKTRDTSSKGCVRMSTVSWGQRTAMSACLNAELNPKEPPTGPPVRTQLALPVIGRPKFWLFQNDSDLGSVASSSVIIEGSIECSRPILNLAAFTSCPIASTLVG